MQKTTIFFICTLVLLLFLNPATARIIVEPEPADVPADAINVDDEEFVPLWEVPPMRLISYFILINFPLLAFPAELICSSGLWAYLGYRTVLQKIPENENRKKIHACIRDNPGISTPRIAEATGISRGAVTYHLSYLRSRGKIKRVHTGGYVGFFLAGTNSTPPEECTLLHMQNATEKEILFLLLDTPGLSQSEIAEAVGISGPAVSWHMTRLGSDGIIQASVAGRKTCYLLMPGIPEILTKKIGPARDTREYEGVSA